MGAVARPIRLADSGAVKCGERSQGRTAKGGNSNSFLFCFYASLCVAGNMSHHGISQVSTRDISNKRAICEYCRLIQVTINGGIYLYSSCERENVNPGATRDGGLFYRHGGGWTFISRTLGSGRHFVRQLLQLNSMHLNVGKPKRGRGGGR